MWRTIILLLAMAMAAAGSAQEASDNVYVYGTVKDYVTGLPLEGVEVLVYRDEVRAERILTDSLGRYEAYLDYDHLYKLWYLAPGKVTKHIEIDARDIPMPLRAGGYGMNVDMTLFKNLPGLEMDVLAQPMGIARYSPVDSVMSWDMEHTTRMRAAISQSMQRYDSLRTLEKKR